MSVEVIKSPIFAENIASFLIDKNMLIVERSQVWYQQ